MARTTTTCRRSTERRRRRLSRGKSELTPSCEADTRPPRGASPSESIASASAYGKDNVPKTARQIAAAAAKARDLAAKQARADDSDEETGDDEPRGSGNGRKSTAMAVSASNDSMAPSGALGIDIGKSREGSASKGVVTPAGNSNKSATKRGTKRGHDDDDDEEEDDEDVPPAKRVTAKKVATAATGAAGYDSADLGDDGAVENDLDSKVYCTCRQVSFGEMIGCDDDDCEIEWVSPSSRASSRRLRGDECAAVLFGQRVGVSAATSVVCCLLPTGIRQFASRLLLLPQPPRNPLTPVPRRVPQPRQGARGQLDLPPVPRAAQAQPQGQEAVQGGEEAVVLVFAAVASLVACCATSPAGLALYPLPIVCIDDRYLTRSTDMRRTVSPFCSWIVIAPNLTARQC